MIVKELKIPYINTDKILLKAALMVEREAKQLCPKDTGILRASIESWTEDNAAYVGTHQQYGIYVHQGTGIYAVNGDGRQTPWSYKDLEGNWHYTQGQKPQPFLSQALENKKEEILELVKESIENG